jgi:hypothetical protein
MFDDNGDPLPGGTSAVRTITRDKLIKEAIERGKPIPDEATLLKAELLAEARNVYGWDAKQRPDGSWIEQGIGSAGHETLNHFMSIRKFEGEAKYQAAVKKMWKENPARARLIGLAEPERLST